MAEDKTTEKSVEQADDVSRRQRVPITLAQVRTVVAQIIWIVCVVFALVLAVAVLLIAVKANTDNGLVRFDGKFADHVDLHWFDLNNPVKDFDTSKKPLTDVKTALFNYGICAIVWLVIGRIADRVVKP